VEIHASARKHGVADADIEHATTHAMAIEDQETRRDCISGLPAVLGCSRSSRSVRDDGSELAIHAMKMRRKYERLLPGG
jgi:hypothetical protein